MSRTTEGEHMHTVLEGTGKTRRRSRRAAVLAAAAAVAVGAAACGSDDGGGGGGGSASGAGAGGPGVTAAREAVDAAKAMPEFKAPGPAFDASGASGNTVFWLSVDNSIPIMQTLGDAIEEAGREVGVSVVNFDGKGSATEFNRGMEQAISRKVDVIILESVSSELLAAPIRRAKAQGIKVIASTERDESVPALNEDADAVTSFKYKEAGELMANWAIADSGGEANVVAIQSSDVVNGQDVRAGMEEQFQKNCPDCEVEFIETQIPDWASRLGTLTRSQLTQNPDVDYVIPFYDGMAQFVAPAVRQAGAAERVKIVSFNATPVIMQMLKRGEIVAADVGGANDWLAWAEMDQALRLMVGEEPVANTQVPLRLFDDGNIDSIDLEADEATWYGTAFKDEYRKLWGVG